jgi:cytochrome c oxidase cbb3-type subunit 1
MDRYARLFVQTSLIYLVTGVVLGVIMSVHEDWTFLFDRAHNHINLIGFVSFMIFGVGYHILPRFTGRPLHSATLANLHVWLANAGLLGMSIFWILDAGLRHVTLQVIAAIFAVLLGISMILFVYNMWKSLIPLPEGE